MAKIICTAIGALRRRRNIAARLRELSALDDRMLEDIGLCRADVARVAEGTL